MSKRKLTRRQSWRVQKVQEEKAARMARKTDQLRDSDESEKQRQARPWWAMTGNG